MSTNKAVAKLFAEVLEDAGYEPYAYSGRGMYGKKCVAINVERGQSIWEIAIQVFKENEDIAEQVGTPTEDDMGLGAVFYWPNLPYEGKSDNEEEDSED